MFSRLIYYQDVAFPFDDYNSGKGRYFLMILGDRIAQYKRPSEKLTIKKAVKSWCFPAFRRYCDRLLSCSWRSLSAHAQRGRAAGRVPGADRAAALAHTG